MNSEKDALLVTLVLEGVIGELDGVQLHLKLLQTIPPLAVQYGPSDIDVAEEVRWVRRRVFRYVGHELEDNVLSVAERAKVPRREIKPRPYLVVCTFHGLTIRVAQRHDIRLP